MKAQQVDENWLAGLARTLEMKLTKDQGDNVRILVAECENL